MHSIYICYPYYEVVTDAKSTTSRLVEPVWYLVRSFQVHVKIAEIRTKSRTHGHRAAGNTRIGRNMC